MAMLEKSVYFLSANDRSFSQRERAMCSVEVHGAPKQYREHVMALWEGGMPTVLPGL